MNKAFSICIAYEQGVGKGRRKSKDTNPYENDSDEFKAWDYGFGEGLNWFLISKVKRTERGWAGHYICSSDCFFRRNTLLEKDNIKIIVSTVGNLWKNDKLEEIGCDRYFETMAFHSDKNDSRYNDLDVNRKINFSSPWSISEKDADDKANIMHENVVKEIIEKMEIGEYND